MIKNILFAILYFSNAAGAQDTVPLLKLPPKADVSQCMSSYGAEVYQNKSFASIATGQARTSDLANYAAFDPVKGSFSLNGFFALKWKKKAVDDSARSYLSFSLKGSLLNNDATVLFKDQKLNTSVSLDAKYHFRIHSKWDFLGGYIQCKQDEIRPDLIARLGLKQKLESDDLVQKFDIGRNNKALILLRAKDALLLQQIPAKQMELSGLILSIYAGPATDIQQNLVSKASHAAKQLDSMEKALKGDIMADDSLIHMMQYASDSLKNGLKRLNTDYRLKVLQAELSTSLFSMHQTWFTIIGSLNNSKYYTYFDSLPFAKQISKSTLLAFDVGLQLNLYWQNLETAQKKKVTYFNFGLLREKTDNTADLSTTTIEQSKTISSGDTTRKINNSYSAYTSKVQSFEEWNLYANYYHMHGPKMFSGYHIYSSLELRETQKQVLNTGVGYIVSVPDKKSSNPVVNAEAYINFTDITNALGASTNFYQRYQIGVRIGLPFNFLTK
jgi:hypothetical protein